MRETKVRLAVGLSLVLLVTAVLAGAVTTVAAVSDELSDGDGCENGGNSIGDITASAENVTTLAGNVTGCIVDGEDRDAITDDPPTGPG